MVLRKKEGKPLPETADMKMWKEEFKEMSLEDHDRVLKNLGLDEEDIEDFNAAEKSGKKLEDILGLGEEGAEEAPKAAPEKPAKKGKK